MKVVVNGEETELTEGATIYELLEGLCLHEQRIAVDLNEAIVSRSKHKEICLQENDCVEIVRAIGGG